MPGQGRLGDKAQIPLDAHGCPACPHPGTGPAIQGSPDVAVNKRPALRVGDPGIHAACCGANTWTAQQGSSVVFINGKAAFRLTDPTKHCGGPGQLIEGSPNVIVGETGGGGAAASASAASASGGAGSQAGAAASASPASSAAPATATSAGTGSSNGPSSGASAGPGAGSSGASPRSEARGVNPTGRSAASSPGAATANPGAARDRASSGDPPPDPPPEPWLEVVMIGADNQPLAGERYVITDPGGREHTGTLDARGTVRLTGIPAGTCKVAFPDLDREAWEAA